MRKWWTACASAAAATVVRKVKTQWMLRITDYAQKLLDGLDDVDFIEKVKTQQRNWIGRSEGAEVDFALTEPATSCACTPPGRTPSSARPTWCISPGAPAGRQAQGADLTTMTTCTAYREAAARKSDFERTELNKDKTGVELEGVRAINPVNGKEIPIWVSDYVLMTYGTGAIMAVPAHDEPRLGVRQEVRPAHRRGGGRRRRAKGSLYRHTGRRDGQLRLPERPEGGGGQEDHDRLAAGKGPGRAQGQLQAARLGVLPPALLGRAHPAWCYCDKCGWVPAARGPAARDSCPRWKTTSPPTTARALWPP